MKNRKIKKNILFALLISIFASPVFAQDLRPFTEDDCTTNDLFHIFASRLMKYDKVNNEYVEFSRFGNTPLNSAAFNRTDNLIYATGVSGPLTAVFGADGNNKRYNHNVISGAQIDFSNGAAINEEGDYIVTSNGGQAWLVDNFVEGVNGEPGTADTREITGANAGGSRPGPELLFDKASGFFYTIRGTTLRVISIDVDALTWTRIAQFPITGYESTTGGSPGAVWIDSAGNMVIYDEASEDHEADDGMYTITRESIVAGAPRAQLFARVLDQSFSTDGASCPFGGNFIPDFDDKDEDKDGISDLEEGYFGEDDPRNVDSDGDGIPDGLDLDSDNDGVPDTIESEETGAVSNDQNRDGVLDTMEDDDKDGIPNSCDVDQTGGSDIVSVDGIDDSCQGGDDQDGDGINDANDPDIDGDGLANVIDPNPTDAADQRGVTPVDTDGDGTPDSRDFDSDNDGLTDVEENNGTDEDGDGKIDCPSGDVDMDGLCDDVDPTEGGTPLEIVDTDLTTDQPDYRDPLDSLVSPVYFIWNGFLNQFNTAVLVNKIQDEVTNVTLTLLDIQGNPFSEITIGVPAAGERDFVINELEGFGADTYGTLRIEFTPAIGAIDGNSLHFRFRADNAAEAEFSHQKPFTNSVRGTSYAVANTIYPSQNPFELLYTTIHWLQIANHNETEAKSFTINRYDATGALFDTQRVTIPAQGRRDIQGGHEDLLSQIGVNRPREISLVQVIADDTSSPYGGELFRYGADAIPGIVPDSYSYGLSQNLEQGDAGTQYAFVSNGADGNNFVEVYNTSGDVDTYTAEVIQNDGSSVYSESIAIAANAQSHISITDSLGAGQSGIIKVSSASGKSFVMRSSVYFLEPNGAVSAAYSETGRSKLFGDSNFGNYNSFLGQFNFLKLFNTSDADVAVGVKVYDTEGALVGESGVNLPAGTGGDFELNAQLFLNVPADTVGRIVVSPSAANAVTGTLLRLRNSDFGGFVDFAKPLPIR